MLPYEAAFFCELDSDHTINYNIFAHYGFRMFYSELNGNEVQFFNCPRNCKSQQI